MYSRKRKLFFLMIAFMLFGIVVGGKTPVTTARASVREGNNLDNKDSSLANPVHRVPKDVSDSKNRASYSALWSKYYRADYLHDNLWVGNTGGKMVGFLPFDKRNFPSPLMNSYDNNFGCEEENNIDEESVVCGLSIDSNPIPHHLEYKHLESNEWQWWPQDWDTIQYRSAGGEIYARDYYKGGWGGTRVFYDLLDENWDGSYTITDRIYFLYEDLQEGIYIVRGCDNSACDNPLFSGEFAVDDPDTPALTEVTATNDSPTPLGDPTTLSASATEGAWVYYVWDLGTGVSDTGDTIEYIYPSQKAYTATVTAYGVHNTVLDSTEVIITEPTPIEGLSASSDSPNRLGTKTTLTADLTSGSGGTYTWDLGDGETATGKEVTHHYPATGSYQATVTALNPVSEETASTTVQISAPTVIYVDQDASGADDGSSWEDAYTDLQSALDAGAGHEIWVAEGVYIPTHELYGGGARSETFSIPQGMFLYGGFSGTEIQRVQRDWHENGTVLSGDLDGNDTVNADGVTTEAADITGSNAYTVVYVSDAFGPIVLDGFTITGGNADGEFDCWGGGMEIYHGSGVWLNNISFRGNYAEAGGGGLSNTGLMGASDPRVTNSIFNNNETIGQGGGFQSDGDANPALVNVTFYGNQADKGGGLSNTGSDTTLSNVILWSNSAATAGSQIYNFSGGPTISHSNIEGSNGSGMIWNSSLGTDGGGNIDIDPLFVDPENGDLSLQGSSMSIDTGDIGSVPEDTLDMDEDGNTTEPIPFDLGCGHRILNYTVDMGAYEYSTGISPTPTPTPVGPEMDVQGNEIAISDGDFSPTEGDGTDFGEAGVSSGTAVHIFSVENTGPMDLNLTGTPKVKITGVNAGDFSVTSQPTSTIPSGGSSTFEITFDPSAEGVRMATITIPNNDSDEDPYDFAVQGVGVDNTFADVLLDHWAYDWVEALYEAGLTSGYPDGTYRPGNPVTRAEMGVFLLKGMNAGTYEPPAPDSSHPFSDISGHWAESWMEELYDVGLTSGYPDGTYRPQNQVTRAEMAVFLLRAKHGAGYSPPAASGRGAFSDIAGHWAEDWIEQLAEEGITGGYPDGTYRPNNPVNRAEMAVFLVRAFDLPVP